MQQSGLTRWWQQAHLALFWATTLVVLILAGTVVLVRASQTALTSRRVEQLHNEINKLQEGSLLIGLQITAARQRVTSSQREAVAPRAASGQWQNASTEYLTLPEPASASPAQESEEFGQPPESFGQALAAWLRESKGINLPEVFNGR